MSGGRTSNCYTSKPKGGLTMSLSTWSQIEQFEHLLNIINKQTIGRKALYFITS